MRVKEFRLVEQYHGPRKQVETKDIMIRGWNVLFLLRLCLLRIELFCISCLLVDT